MTGEWLNAAPQYMKNSFRLGICAPAVKMYKSRQESIPADLAETTWESSVPLLALWKSSASAVSDFNVEQVVATAGDGSLLDASECSNELRSCRI
jgi:hypothetical protein